MKKYAFLLDSTGAICHQIISPSAKWFKGGQFSVGANLVFAPSEVSARFVERKVVIWFLESEANEIWSFARVRKINRGYPNLFRKAPSPGS